MRVFLCALALTGCGADDPCDPFPDETCLSLEVRGPGLSVDQIGVQAVSGFALADGRSPADPGRSYDLPVRLPVLPGGRFAGAVELEVRGFLTGLILGSDSVHATVAAGQHLSIIAELGGSHANDLAGVDFSGRPDLAHGAADLAIPTGADLAGADLAAAVGAFVPESSGLTSTALLGVFGFSPDVYAVALGGSIIHSKSGGPWQLQRTGKGGLDEVLIGVWGPTATNLFAFGGQTLGGSTFGTLLLRSTGNGSWSPVTPVIGSDGNFSIQIHGFGGSAGNDLYAGVGGSTTATVRGALHSTNALDWNKQTATSSPDIQAPNHLFVISASSIYLIDSRVWHSSGDGNWAVEALPGTIESPFLNAVWAASANNVYAVGSFGPFGMEKPLVVHSTGNGVWTQESLPTINGSNMEAVFGGGANDVWVVGDSSQVLHFDGGGWTAQPSGTTANLHGVWTDGVDVFAVGENGAIVHKH